MLWSGLRAHHAGAVTAHATKTAAGAAAAVALIPAEALIAMTVVVALAATAGATAAANKVSPHQEQQRLDQLSNTCAATVHTPLPPPFSPGIPVHLCTSPSTPQALRLTCAATRWIQAGAAATATCRCCLRTSWRGGQI